MMYDYIKPERDPDFIVTYHSSRMKNGVNTIYFWVIDTKAGYVYLKYNSEGFYNPNFIAIMRYSTSEISYMHTDTDSRFKDWGDRGDSYEELASGIEKYIQQLESILLE